jgi:hypothetical protein
VRFEGRQPEIIQKKAFSLALAFGAGQFPALFDHISFSVADNTNHFILPASASPAGGSQTDVLKPGVFLEIKAFGLNLHHPCIQQFLFQNSKK